MNQTSSIVTGSATAAAVSIAPLVDWILNTQWHAAAPSQVVLIISAGIITIGHFACNLANESIAKNKIADSAKNEPARNN